MSVNTLDDLFEDHLKDIYYAEKQILKALPKMAKKAESPQLREAFENHHAETEGQVERLEQAFDELGKSARGKKCEAIEGLLEEGKELMEEADSSKPVLDCGLLAGAQAVEHYEMARYGALIAWAKLLGHTKIAQLLEQNLKEEKNADALLSKLASSEINAAAKKNAESRKAA